MIGSAVFDTFAEAYVQGVRDILSSGDVTEAVKDPLSIGSQFGGTRRQTIEIIGYTFQVNNPFSSLFLSDDRILRLGYCFGLFLWSMSGSNELDWISYYNAAAHKFSDDGKILPGAFGKRLIAYGDSIDQIEAIRRTLMRDPASRRTVGVVSLPIDNFKQTREYPCCIAVQYFIRKGSLCAISFMRSQSACMVLPYDAFLFMSLQCLLAARMDLKPGYYKHISGSFHVYEDELDLVRRIATNGASPVEVGSMLNPGANLRELQEFESELRESTISGNLDRVEEIALRTIDGASFFGEARAILLVDSLLKVGLTNLTSRVAENLRSPMKELARRFATRGGS